MSLVRSGWKLAVIVGVGLGIAGCAAAPSADLAAATPAAKPATPPVAMVAEVLGQRLDAMLAADIGHPHPSP